MIAIGACAMFLLQSAMDEGGLLVFQSALTTADPVIGILWGVLVFHEEVRGGLFILLAVACAAAAGTAVMMLSSSPLAAPRCSATRRAARKRPIRPVRARTRRAAGGHGLKGRPESCSPPIGDREPRGAGRSAGMWQCHRHVVPLLPAHP
ncbi:hypothetical protein [Streptomyces sp. NPDC021356]|uniref:hypothetical protein n=1 Tax=Streptomyces sp. NPDC021356 TaxID=3154900 RepID=UPI0033E1A88A